jgi:tRNA G18 (ribose-2'-O)-methylase SpoU
MRLLCPGQPACLQGYKKRPSDAILDAPGLRPAPQGRPECIDRFSRPCGTGISRIHIPRTASWATFRSSLRDWRPRERVVLTFPTRLEREFDTESPWLKRLPSCKDPREPQIAKASKLENMEILFGLHPVEEALRSGTRKFDHICIARERQDARLEKLIQACRDAGVRLRIDTRDQLTKLARTEAHQGVVAIVRARQFLELDDLLQGPSRNRLLLALDGVEDPQNLGALLRTAEGAGVDGVVVTERRSAPLSPVAVKASAGAAEHIKIARVVNLVRTLEELKQRELWCGVPAITCCAFPWPGGCPRSTSAPRGQWSFTRQRGNAAGQRKGRRLPRPPRQS